MKIVQKPDGFYIVDESGQPVKGPFQSPQEAQQALAALSGGTGGPPPGPGVPPPMGPGGPPGAPPGGGPDPQMLMALLSKLKGGG
jgi:hypothetical protein